MSSAGELTSQQISHIEAIVKQSMDKKKNDEEVVVEVEVESASEPKLVAGKEQSMFFSPTLASQEDALQLMLETKNLSSDDKVWVKLSVEDDMQDTFTKAQNFFVFTTSTLAVAVNAAKLFRKTEDDWDCKPKCNENCNPDYTTADNIYHYGKKGIMYSVIGLALAYYGKSIYSLAKESDTINVKKTIDPNLPVSSSD
jgi:hypothetical protein